MKKTLCQGNVRQGNKTVFDWQRPTDAELASIGRKLKRRIGRVMKAKGMIS